MTTDLPPDAVEAAAEAMDRMPPNNGKNIRPWEDFARAALSAALPALREAPETAYVVPDGPKELRETLCVAQTYIGLSDDSRKREHSDRLQRLIDECDRHRPVGPDGKHGDKHTPTCGCEDKPVRGEDR